MSAGHQALRMHAVEVGGHPSGADSPEHQECTAWFVNTAFWPPTHPPPPDHPPTHPPPPDLYTAAAGVPPHQILPVTLDVGTNNQALLDEPSYGGLRQRRVVGEQYDALVEEFIQALKAWQPHVLLQFEVRRLRSVGARLGSETHAAVDASLLA